MALDYLMGMLTKAMEKIMANLLPKTGQTVEYYPGDDGTYQAGWEGVRFVDNGDGTVTDNATGLMWPKDWTDFSPYESRKNWEDTIDYLEGLTLFGYSDWRMPNAYELLSLFNPGVRPYNTFAIFTNVEDLGFWSSSTPSNSPTAAYAVYPQYLWTYDEWKVDLFYGVPVRKI